MNTDCNESLKPFMAFHFYTSSAILKDAFFTLSICAVTNYEPSYRCICPRNIRVKKIKINLPFKQFTLRQWQCGFYRLL